MAGAEDGLLVMHTTNKVTNLQRDIRRINLIITPGRAVYAARYPSLRLENWASDVGVHEVKIMSLPQNLTCYVGCTENV